MSCPPWQPHFGLAWCAGEAERRRSYWSHRRVSVHLSHEAEAGSYVVTVSALHERGRAGAFGCRPTRKRRPRELSIRTLMDHFRPSALRRLRLFVAGHGAGSTAWKCEGPASRAFAARRSTQDPCGLPRTLGRIPGSPSNPSNTVSVEPGPAQRPQEPARPPSLAKLVPPSKHSRSRLPVPRSSPDAGITASPNRTPTFLLRC